jgi:hypothetical protein
MSARVKPRAAAAFDAKAKQQSLSRSGALRVAMALFVAQP